MPTRSKPTVKKGGKGRRAEEESDSQQHEATELTFLNQKVEKEFPPHGLFKGCVINYDEKELFYQIRYEDGDEEEMVLEELKKHLVSETKESIVKPPLKKKKMKKDKEVVGAAMSSSGSGTLMKQYRMKWYLRKKIISFGDETYTDCRPCEREDAEDFAISETERLISGKGKYKTLKECNEAAENKFNELQSDISPAYSTLNIVSDIKGEKNQEVDLEDGCEVHMVKKTRDPVSGQDTWSWSFHYEDNEYQHDVLCSGYVGIETVG
mmetsp:Transcript_7584/g.8975  ORF Transcript_7584/g.8975 Transcript_7584/m.8975 type:complete len:266 (+) Transcript_7584:88-885(+)